MSPSLSIAYFAHSIRSDWNNGNAHFLRGLLRAMTTLGHFVTVFEPEDSWSMTNLRSELLGQESLVEFAKVYPELQVETYTDMGESAEWRARLQGMDIVIVHEWNMPELARLLVRLRGRSGFRLLFHDTHHRASSSPEQIELFQLDRFDGILAFGQVLETIYRERFGLENVWTMHEAADVTVFKPRPDVKKTTDVVWIGNWGDGERSAEIHEFLLDPVEQSPALAATIYGVRYPAEGLEALLHAGVRYGGYLPNLHAPDVYAAARMTVHIPRRQYASTMPGIPTIRVFEALACGIPLLSAPWLDVEQLFRPGDFEWVSNGEEMRSAMMRFENDPEAARAQAKRGLQTVLDHHTCDHRARQLTTICEGLL